MSYLEYAREAKAVKKFKTVMTAALRMHPTKPELWLYAAKWILETESDMSGARSYMQRGTRFCTRSADLWIEYAKLEMIYLAKIGMRRRILGLDGRSATDDTIEADVANEDDAFSTSKDVVAISDFTAHTLHLSTLDGVKVDSEAVKDPMITPALNGAIPLAIFDDARQQSFYSVATAEDFFNMFTAFTLVSCQLRILQHVLDSMLESFPSDPSTLSCFIRQPIIGIDPKSAAFPMALASSLERLKSSREKSKDSGLLSKKIALWFEELAKTEDLDVGVETVLKHTLRRLQY
jgi:U3 small nucleolar RNA-associated protein 6